MLDTFWFCTDKWNGIVFLKFVLVRDIVSFIHNVTVCLKKFFVSELQEVFTSKEKDSWFIW